MECQTQKNCLKHRSYVFTRRRGQSYTSLKSPSFLQNFSRLNDSIAIYNFLLRSLCILKSAFRLLAHHICVRILNRVTSYLRIKHMFRIKYYQLILSKTSCRRSTRMVLQVNRIAHYELVYN